MRCLLLLALTCISLCRVAPLSAQGGGVLYYDFERGESAEPSVTETNEADRYLLSVPLAAYGTTFSSLSDFNFSFVRYFRRGYEHRMRKVYLDGIDLGDGIEASVNWNVLSALNSAYGDNYRGFGPTPVDGYVGLLGATDIYTVSAVMQSALRRVSLMTTDRRFAAGARFVLSSGRGRNGWAYSVSGSRRFGRDAHIKGLFSDDWTATASVSRRLTTDSWLSLSFLAAPSERGARGASTRDAFGLYGDNLYNPYWGYHDAKMRSSRVRKESRPVVLASWHWEPSQRFRLMASLSYMFGRGSYSSLDWYDARQPLPDYYRYMPDYFVDPYVSETIAGAWRSRNPKVTQIDWEELYYVNRSSAGSRPASYIVSSDVREMNNVQAVVSGTYDISSLLRLNAGARLRRDRDLRYSRLDDLLGAQYITDVDQFLVDDQYYGDKLLNNVRDPQRMVRAGDMFGYNYSLGYDSYGVWGVLEIGRAYRSGKLSGYAALELDQVSIWRQGHYEKELFPGNASFGKSAKVDVTEYTLKGGLRLIPTPANVLSLDVVYADMAPSVDEIFISHEYRNAFAGVPRAMNVLSGEFGYRLALPSLEFTVNAYTTRTDGQNEVLHFYDDISGQYSNAVMYDVAKLYSGVEAGVMVDITSRLAVRLAAAGTYNVYLNDPETDIYSDKSSELVDVRQEAFVKGYRIGGTPQSVVSTELRYSGAKMWLASVALNYAADNYISLNPLRRMKRVFDNVKFPEQMAALTSQECFAPAVTVNIFLSKTFPIGSGYLSVSGSVNNITNRKDIVYSGYEQMRLTKSGTGINRALLPFASKYYFGYGRTYYLTVNYRF